MVTVSIIIPFYNCMYVDRAIESALAQTYPYVEVIVVNDGSTMHTDRLTPYHSRIHYIEKKNGGTASALNAGIQQASGTYFTWLSSDDEYLPQKVEHQLAFMQTRGAMFSHTAYYHINEASTIISPPLGANFPDRLSLYRSLRQGCAINGCTVMLHTDVFKQAGFFDETLRYTQDYDFWLRLLPLFDLHYLNEPLLRYRVHANMGTKKHESHIPAEIQKVIIRHRPSLIRLIQRETYKK